MRATKELAGRIVGYYPALLLLLALILLDQALLFQSVRREDSVRGLFNPPNARDYAAVPPLTGHN